NKLPQGAGPIQFNSNFGDTAALMLTIASPRASDIDIALRARSVKRAIENARSALPKNAPQPRVSVVVSFPQSVAAEEVNTSFRLVDQLGVRRGAFQDPHLFQGPGFIGLDVSTQSDDRALEAWGDRITQERFHRSEIHPDSWRPAFIRNSNETEA